MRVRIFLTLSAILLLVTIAMDLLLIPSLASVQNKDLIQYSPIFYWHIPVAWVALFAFLCVFMASIAYLWKRTPFWDIVATTSAELGVVFTTLFLLTGSIWAKFAWGTWWAWDARLTTSLVLWIIYVAYFLLRAYISSPEQRARFAAVFGILGFVDVPIVILTLFVSNQMHPGDAAFHLDRPQMIITLVTGVVAFTLLYFGLLFFGIHLREDAYEISKLKESDGG
ncbi:MAG: cytochrome c biogenesis protein CcsA [Dehalococcoidales bacterium]|jgi:heme exporter protein C